MVLISHRGNTEGRNPERENRIDYIQEALAKGFNVEIDVWGIDGKIYLGHDGPQEEVHGYFLSGIKLWVHAKNIEAVNVIKNWNRNADDKIHWFWHENDHMTLTSLELLWVYPGKELPIGAIAVMPELHEGWDLQNAIGICSDYILKYKIEE